MAIKKELLDELLQGRDPKLVLSSAGLLVELKKALADRILSAEMDQHLTESKQDEGSEAHSPNNHRNGYSVTDAVLEEVGKCQNRPLDPLYALVSLDALRVKMRDEGTVRNKAVYLAICVTPDGRKNVLGIWIEQTEGAKFWLRVMTVIRNRGTNDILIAIVDGLNGFPDAINAVFPETQIQTCIVHMTRNS